MDKIRVALAEDNVLLREGVSRLIAANEDFELVGTASDLPELLALVGAEHPDVGVVVLSQFVSPGYAMELFEHGSAARAYLLKERVGSVDELARAIRAVAGGGSVIDPLVVDELVRSRSQHRHSSLGQLTAREVEILAEMAQGKSNAAIAAALSVSERAVEKHTNSIFAKLGLSEEKDLNRRVKAVLLYLSETHDSVSPEE